MPLTKRFENVAMRSLHPASIGERDTRLGLLFEDEIDRLESDMFQVLGRPIGLRAMVYRSGNAIYARGTKAYRTNAAVFFDAWIIGKHGGMTHETTEYEDLR